MYNSPYNDYQHTYIKAPFKGNGGDLDDNAVVVENE